MPSIFRVEVCENKKNGCINKRQANVSLTIGIKDLGKQRTKLEKGSKKLLDTRI
jgi:hypothetical protein